MKGSDTLPKYLCFENNFSKECPIDPQKCTDSKLRKVTGQGINGVGTGFLYLGLISVFLILEAGYDPVLLKTGIGGLLVGLPLVYVGEKIEGKECKE